MSSNARPPAGDFFAEFWAVYRLTIDHDYLWHGRVAAGLRAVLSDKFAAGHPLRFLDLACGDADITVKALGGRTVGRYVGVDRSAQALNEARPRVATLHSPADLVEADYLEYLEASREAFDAIYVGLSAHHLGEPRLDRFFAAAKPRLAANGVLVAYEPFTLPDETRDEHTERLCEMVDTFWLRMTSEQRQMVTTHVRANDFPTSLERWDRMATANGLTPARRAMKTPDRLYEMVVHTGQARAAKEGGPYNATAS